MSAGLPIAGVETPVLAPISPDRWSRTCDHCGATYRPYRQWARFCSPRCRSAAFIDRKVARLAEAKRAKKREKAAPAEIKPGNPKLVAAMVRGLLTACRFQSPDPPRAVAADGKR